MEKFLKNFIIVKRQFICFAFFCLTVINVNAQEADKKGVFLYTGFSSSLPGNSNSFLFYYGYSPSDNFQSITALPFFKIHKNVQLMPGYMMTKADGEPMFTNVQHHLLPSVLLNFKLSEKFSLTDRNMFYHLFRKDAKDINQYRNRIGFFYHTKIAEKPANIFVQDEVNYSFNTDNFTRNKIIFGTSIKVAKWLTPQVWYAFQADRSKKPQQQIFVILTVSLENYGVFKKKEN